MCSIELPTIDEDSTSSDMSSDIPAVIPVIKPKKEVSVMISFITMCLCIDNQFIQ